MAYTTEQYNALTAAIATGALKVKYSDKEVTYRSLTEMYTVKADMEKALGLNTNRTKRTYAEFSKGLR